MFIVTGGYSGVGLELYTILYQAGGKVYVAGRSEPKAKVVISKIKGLPCTSPGELAFLPLSLDDLATIKPAVETFTSKCLGHYLLTQLVLPCLRSITNTVPSAAVRVIWTSSIIVDLSAPDSGMNLSDLENPSPDQQRNYVDSKVGNWFLASSLATQDGSDGILSMTQNPGNLNTELLRYMPRIVGFVTAPLLYTARMGAYTELWAGLSMDLTIKDRGQNVLPWGRFHPS